MFQITVNYVSFDCFSRHVTCIKFPSVTCTKIPVLYFSALRKIIYPHVTWQLLKYGLVKECAGRYSLPFSFLHVYLLFPPSQLHTSEISGQVWINKNRPWLTGQFAIYALYVGQSFDVEVWLKQAQELEYLVDVNAINLQQLSEIVAKLPSPSSNNASLLNETTPVHHTSIPAQSTDPEKQPHHFPSSNPLTLPPPAYATPNAAVVLANALALYEYHPSDSGDLAILPKDCISITEFMNADWAKGRNERTHAEGIFPRSYVEIVDEKSAHAGPQQPPSSNYGNMPLDVSQSGSGVANPAGGKESKFGQNANKFGKKLGNASEFI